MDGGLTGWGIIISRTYVCICTQPDRDDDDDDGREDDARFFHIISLLLFNIFLSVDRQEREVLGFSCAYSFHRPTDHYYYYCYGRPSRQPPSYPRYYAHPLSWLPTLALERRQKAWKETSKQYNFFSGHIIYKTTTHEYRIIKMMMTRDVLLHLMGLPLDTL